VCSKPPSLSFVLHCVFSNSLTHCCVPLCAQNLPHTLLCCIVCSEPPSHSAVFHCGSKPPSHSVVLHCVFSTSFTLCCVPLCARHLPHTVLHFIVCPAHPSKSAVFFVCSAPRSQCAVFHCVLSTSLTTCCIFCVLSTSLTMCCVPLCAQQLPHNVLCSIVCSATPSQFFSSNISGFCVFLT